MNKVIRLGRLTRDPEIRYTQSSEPMAIARYALAVNRRSRREGQPDADFINCTAFGRAAEFTEKYFKKGMLVCVSGRLQIQSYEKNGARQYYTDVVIEEQDFAESKSSFQSRHNSAPEDVAWHGATADSAPKSGPPPAARASDDDFFTIDQSLDDEELPF
jgi:single-strand DNA-binding protein